MSPGTVSSTTASPTGRAPAATRGAHVASAVCLALVLALAVVHVLALPAGAESMTAAYPEVAYLRLPFTWIFGGVLVALQVALLAFWKLLPAVSSGSRLRRGEAAVLDGIAVVLVVVGLVLAGVNSYLSSDLRANPPLVGLGLLVSSVTSFGLAAAAVWVRRDLGLRSNSRP